MEIGKKLFLFVKLIFSRQMFILQKWIYFKCNNKVILKYYEYERPNNVQDYNKLNLNSWWW